MIFLSEFRTWQNIDWESEIFLIWALSYVSFFHYMCCDVENNIQINAFVKVLSYVNKTSIVDTYYKKYLVTLMVFKGMFFNVQKC